jgi:uncharacterized protein (TIGR03435 family)
MSVSAACSLRLVLAIGISAAAYGQTAPQPSFEVASVKPGESLFSTRPERSPGRIRWTTQLNYLIGYAYRLDFSRVSCRSGGLIYSLDAKFDPAATEDQVRLMVQSLLTDRFKMQARRVTTETDGYALVIGKGGLETREADPADDSYIFSTMPEVGVIAITGRGVSMS